MTSRNDFSSARMLFKSAVAATGLAIVVASRLYERWVGDQGAIIGLDRFGASAPAAEIFEHLGFTAERVIDVARRVVREGLRGRIAPLGGDHA